MKHLVALVMLVSLQLAVARLCLCSGMHREGDPGLQAGTHSCCEVQTPASGEGPGHPCPHCDQADELELGIPAKCVAAPDQPVLDLMVPEMATTEVAVPAPVFREASRFGRPPPLLGGSCSLCELFGVFLI